VALRLAHAAWEFLVGDDWPTAVGVVLSLAVTALLATSVLAALVLLRWSVLRRARSLQRPGR
jgi:hypothetical protein